MPMSMAGGLGLVRAGWVCVRRYTAPGPHRPSRRTTSRAPLEQAVDRTVRLLGRIPKAAPFTDILDRRTPGIRDLLHGTLTEQIDELADVVEPEADEPWLEGVDHHLIVGRLARSERPLNRLVGDLLVTAPSATGRGPRRRIEGERVHVVPVVANHFGLCWRPQVADHLLEHLAAR